MNRTPVAQAVGAALLLASGAASAYVPTSNTDADIVIYWAGATASTLSAQELTVNSICDTVANGAAAPTLLYVNNTASNDAPGNDWAVACNTSTAPNATQSGLPQGKRVLIVKRDRDGSGSGVGPLASANTITFLTIAGNCTATPTGSGRPTFLDPNGATIALVGCPSTIPATTLYSTSRVVEMGTSDIEPSKFFGLNAPTLDGVLTPVGTLPLQINATGTLLFNTPVTLALYRVLQRNQYPTTSVCHPDHADFGQLTTNANDRADATNAESEACMPSLTRAEINSLLTGRIVTWGQLMDSTGVALDTSATAGLQAIAGAVQICRRVPGSGSQASINALISGYPCDVNRADNSIDTIPPRTPNGTQVIGNSGSSDVDNCLHSFNSVTANPYAIGILSLERNVNNTRNWRYIKVDGVAPTLANVHAGDYSIWVQQSAQRRAVSLADNTAITVDDTTANKTTIWNRISNRLNNPATLCTLSNTYTWGRSGWLATATSTNVYSNATPAFTTNCAALAAGDYVNAYTREYSPGLTNACQIAVKATAGGNAGRGTTIAPNPNWTR